MQPFQPKDPHEPLTLFSLGRIKILDMYIWMIDTNIIYEIELSLFVQILFSLCNLCNN